MEEGRMIKFICDSCGSETDSCTTSRENGDIIPSTWITVGAIHNDTQGERGVVYSERTVHLCCRTCLDNFFFKKREGNIR